MKKEFSYGISVIRVVAMLSIVLGHICTWQNIEHYQLGGIGVEIFLLISGYLYGIKEISDKKVWLVGRVRKVLIPFWILALILSLYMAVTSSWRNALLQICTTGLNLQGIRWIFSYPFNFLYNLPGLSHCWFLTVIMICYLCVTWMKGSKLEEIIDDHLGMSLIVAAVLQFILVFLGVQVCYFIQFFCGYFYRRYQERKQGCKEREFRLYRSVTILTIVVCAARLIARNYVDGTVFYDRFVARASYSILGFWLYLTMATICRCMPTITESISKSRVWRRLEALSFYIFLVHYMFMTSPFDLAVWISEPLLQVTVLLMFTYYAAVGLEQLDKYVNSLCKKENRGSTPQN